MKDELDQKKSEKKAEGLPLLGEDRKRELRKQAQEAARKKLQEEEEEKFLAQEIAKYEDEERKRTDNGAKLDFVEHRIELAPSAKHVKINGQVYQHGVKYRLRRDVYDSIRDIEAKTWKQESLRRGETDNPYKLRDRHSLSARA
jgi:hypothetical protein